MYDELSPVIKPSDMTDLSSSNEWRPLVPSDRCDNFRSSKGVGILVGEAVLLCKLPWLSGLEKLKCCLSFDRLATDKSDLLEGDRSCWACRAGEVGQDRPLPFENCLGGAEKVEPPFELV